MPASGTIKLLDANIWLALAFSDHAHHAKAAAWFDRQADGTCAFCRLTQLALLRHLTNPVIMGSFVQSPKQAWETYDKCLADPRTTFQTEPHSVETEFRKLAQTLPPSRHVWTDAYLAALAATSALELVTFDQGYKRFPTLRLELLSA
jgi:uncharacterized protein